MLRELIHIAKQNMGRTGIYRTANRRIRYFAMEL